MADHPRILQTVIDTTDLRGLAEFYRELFGLSYRPGDETPTEGEDWLVLRGDGPWLGPHLRLDGVVDAIEGQRRLRPLAEAFEAQLILRRQVAHRGGAERQRRCCRSIDQTFKFR